MLAPKQLFWKVWYQYLTNRVGSDPVIFLNYGFFPAEGEILKLNPEDEHNRPAIQLYHHVASGADLAGKNVLEVSCGHGGGASFIKRYHKPKTYTAIDQNPKAIEFNRRRYAALGLEFRTGDAQALEFPDGHFDAVLNVEASHCYPRQNAFFKSVYRVLKKDGHFLYADFRVPTETSRLDHDLETAGFRIKSKTDITANVVMALKHTSQHNRTLVHKYYPRVLYPILEKFAGVEGTGVYNNFTSRRYIYYSYCLVKATA